MKKLNQTDEFEYYQLASGAKLVRFVNMTSILEHDRICDRDKSLGWRSRGRDLYMEKYMDTRRQMNYKKRQIIRKAQKELSMDKDFLDLIYKAKTAKRKYTPNKHGGILSMPAYVTNSKEVFLKRKPGAKKSTIDMAFQVGRLSGENYTSGFVGIIKTILMAQALNINLNIDMFDSDTSAIGDEACYTIVRVADSRRKLNMNDILLCSDSNFFNFTLFNSYSASGNPYDIGSFLKSNRIKEDLSPMYDVIGGNMLSEDPEVKGTVSKLMKIASI